MEEQNIRPDLTSMRHRLAREAIGDDFILMDNIREVPFLDAPTKVDYCVGTICLEGRVEGSINLRPCVIQKNDFLILLPNQIVQYTYVSDDFRGLNIIMSGRFLESLELSMKESIPVMLRLQEDPIVHLTDGGMKHLMDFYALLRGVVSVPENPYRPEMARLLTQTIFYGMNYFGQRSQPVAPKSKREELFGAFYNLLLEYHKESREVGFYAGKLFLTPKYLSAVVKEATGKSAFEWISNYVILEAKSLLKSTNMTIQQVSEELNFPNQSFFGKYFRHHTGLSPKEYRKA